MACVLAEMDQASFPTLADKALDHQSKVATLWPYRIWLLQTEQGQVKNLAQYGMPFKDMGQVVPTYFIQQQEEGTALETDPGSCFVIPLLSFMGLSICGEVLGL
ncbi:Hypothetical predicted protein [Lynx pardinus]|uniref:Uncharacterized protein n=1 Tax=Lynx pardinus TaxID=191816 RepID=A0A485MF82_LYNPA|nr:Hypothetical predicted protein [Lynx pardinus]